MAEENKKDINNEGEEGLTLETLDSLDPEVLTDNQKTFIEENKDNLSDEQKEKFGIKEEEEIVDPEKIEVETRSKKEGENKEKIEDEGEIDPDDEKIISKIVDRKIDPFRKENQALKDEIEVNSFIQSKPEFAKYKPVILKYMSHEAYSKIPVHNIATMVASNDLQKMGAQNEREAQKKANETKSPGSGVRKSDMGAVDWTKASKEEYEAQRAKVLGQVG